MPRGPGRWARGRRTSASPRRFQAWGSRRRLVRRTKPRLPPRWGETRSPCAARSRSCSAVAWRCAQPRRISRGSCVARVPGTTLLLAPGRYMGPFEIRVEVRIVGGVGVVLDSTDEWCSSTLRVCCAGRVVLESLDVRHASGSADTHAFEVRSGAVTTNNCTFSSAVGACVTVANPGSSLVLRGGVVSQGFGAGVIVADGARAHGTNVSVRDNAVAGFEVRNLAELDLDNCELRSNNRQGVLLWCGGKSARITRCTVEGHEFAGGVVCQDGELTMTRCTVDSNLWGIVVEGRGSASVKSCEVRKSTLDGILVQDGGTALLEDNTIHHNTVHGIFIGYDVRRQVTVRNNSLHHNAKEGIVNGVPKVKKVIIEGNKEWDNMRMLVDPAVARVTKRTMDRLGRGELQVRKGEAETKEQKERKAVTAAVEARRWNENARKTGGAEELRKAVEYVSTLNDAGILDEFNARRPLLEESVCLECGTPTPDGKKPFVCGRCKVAVYCSAACQKAHWKKEDDGHKGECKKFVEFPAFNSGEGVRSASSAPDPAGATRELLDKGEGKPGMKEAALAAMQTLAMLGQRAPPKLHSPQGRPAVEAKLERIKIVGEAAMREGFTECKAYSRAVEHVLAFMDLKDQGDLGEEAFSHLYEAHFINERAPVLDLKDKEWGRSFAQRLIKNPSTSPKMRCRALFVQGILSGDPTTSLPLFAQLQRESPPSARVCELLGSLNGFLQKWGELQRFSLLSLEIDPNFYHSHYTLGVAAKQISDLPKAINHYKTFIEVCPKDARKSVDALFGVAHCYTRLSLPSEGSMGKPPSKEMLAEATKYYNLGVAREKELSPFWGVSEQGDRQILESMLPLLEASGR